MQEVPAQEVEESETPEPEAQPFNEEQEALIKTRMEEAATKAVTEANEVSSKRFSEYQSQTQKQLNVEKGIARSAQNRERGLDNSRIALERPLAELSPEVAASVRNSHNEAEVTRLRQAEVDNDQSRQMQEIEGNWRGVLERNLKKMGVDPTDSKLDWATDLAPTDFLGIQERLYDSAIDISREAMTAKVGQETDDKITKALKDAGINQVETGAPTGGGNNNDKEFQRKWNSGEIESTKANQARIDSILAKSAEKE